MPTYQPYERWIFPTLLNEAERLLLDQLSTERGVSKSQLIRTLIYKEVSNQKKRGKPMRTVAPENQRPSE